MPVYPVRVPLFSYRGANPAKVRRKQNYDRIAVKVERYLNDELRSREDGIHVFHSLSVAADIGETHELVRDVVGAIAGGSNGVMIRKGEPSN